jgi:hypothetical protein
MSINNLRIENLEETYLDSELRKKLQQGYVDATREEHKRWMEGALDYIYGRPYDSERVEQGDMLYDLGHSKAKEISTTVEEDEEERLAKIYKPYHRGWVDRVV